ncbi:MAG TPA: hypothetical protein VM223_01765 [Planctomycetota bacterium]|nr:hypothetical protein [Planctomycetota bacterium]
MARQQSTGACTLCGAKFGKSGMTKHLEACLVQHVADEHGKSFRTARFFHVVVQGRYTPDYWLHLGVRSNAKLEQLDKFLRGIWLECCGHLSAFTIAGTTYSSYTEEEYGDEGMDEKLADVPRGVTFFHDYDFGTTTHLRLRIVGEYDAPASKERVTLLARNDPPDIRCSCGKPAVWVCCECGYQPSGWMCSECGAKHKCGTEMLLPIVNSPRTGQCGYTGNSDYGAIYDELRSFGGGDPDEDDPDDDDDAGSSS